MPISIPDRWYDLQADFNIHLDPLIFETDNKHIYPSEILSENDQPYVTIPQAVIDQYSIYRPTPLLRAKRFEKFIETSCKILYKYEGNNPVGSHKLNTAIPQAFFASRAGFKEMTTATGAGQWGSAVAFAASKFNLRCTIFFVAISLRQKPYRKVLMELLGANVISSPSDKTEFGRSLLLENSLINGSMGIATSEAIDYANRYGSIYGETSHARGIILHQTVIGLESVAQMNENGMFPDIVIGCVGGGTNFGGISTPFLKYKLNGAKNTRFIAVESTANPSLTQGEYKYDYADANQLTPRIKMFTLGHDHVPDPIHAGGLRYHGFDPLLSKLYSEGVIEAQAYEQQEVFRAGEAFFKSEGYLPAPESAHAIAAVISEAKKPENKDKTILFSLSGHGYLDLSGYEYYLNVLRKH